MSVADLIRLPDDAPIATIQGMLDTINEANINDMHYYVTPLLWAIETERPEVVRAVLDKGADPNFENPGNGQEPYISVPLSKCIQYDSPVEMVDMLLERGANPNGIANRAGTPLLNFAIENGDGDIARRLIEAGANINFLDAYGHTVLDNTNRRIRFYQRRGRLDVQHRLEQVRDLLLERGARPATAAERAQGLLAMQPAAPVAGVAFEIHNAFDKINMQRFIAFMEREMPDGEALFTTAPTNPEFGTFVIESLQNLHIGLPNNSNANRNRKQQALSDLNAFSERLRLVNYDDNTRKIIFYTIQFLTRQSQEFRNTYIKNFSFDCAQAYGAGEVSCTKGIMERIVTTLTPASLLYAGNPIYDELVTIINPRLLKDIFDEEASECAKLPNVTKEQFRACIHEKIQQRYVAQGTAYNAETIAAVNTKLNETIPVLGIFDGGARKRQTRKTKKKARKTRARARKSRARR